MAAVTTDHAEYTPPEQRLGPSDGSASARRLLHRVAFAGGGSGGHLFPSIAIAWQLQREGQQRPAGQPMDGQPEGNTANCDFLFFVSPRPVDQIILEQFQTDCRREYPSTQCRFRVTETATGQQILRTPWRSVPQLLKVVWQAFAELRRHRPQVLIGTGGFVSVAPILAAAALRIPVVLVEQNTVPGAAIRFLARFARLICAGLPLADQERTKLRCNVVLTGIPVRREISELSRLTGAEGSAHDNMPAEKPRLLILGGSQGAARLNTLVQNAFVRRSELLQQFDIVHQTGPQQLEELTTFYQIRNPAVRTSAFLTKMADEYHRAALILSRSGATTLAEICCAGRPAILLPLSSSANDHQRRNALWMQQEGAAEIIDESDEAAAEHLADSLTALLQDSSRRRSMSAHAARLAKPEATTSVITELQNILTVRPRTAPLNAPELT